MARLFICTLVMALASVTAYGETQWFKGATHVHSLWSDGDAAPEHIIHWYKTRGWDFVCNSEHNTLMQGERYEDVLPEGKLTPARVQALSAEFGKDWVELQYDEAGALTMRLKTIDELRAHFEKPGEFILVPSEEMTTLKGNPHVNALNLREVVPGLPGDGGKTEMVQHYVDQIAAQSRKYGQPMIAHINHVNFSDRVTTEELLEVKGLAFFEVYNGHANVFSWGIPAEGAPSGERHWDVILSMKQRREPDYLLYGVATDDSHHYHDYKVGESNPGRGWVMVRAEVLEPNAIVAAMQRGDFYASTGVTLKDVKNDGKSLSISIDGAEGVTYKTQYIGTRKDFDEGAKPVVDAAGVPLPRSSLIYSDSIGVVLHETTDLDSSYTFAGDELYVRARVVSNRVQANPHAEGDYEMAWVQPVLARE
jgi:hypothetical protein